MACEPEDVMAGAQSLCCIPPNLHAAVQSYLLARIRGGSMDVNEIVREAACELSCIPPGLLPRIKTYLLCQLSNTGGGVIPEPPPCDADAEAFIAAAGLTDETQIGAVCVLVRDLKTYPAVGTKYWDREFAIYPFVGGNAAAHAVNLKTPGTFDLTYIGGGLIHSANGVQGDAIASWARTGFLIPALNSARIMYYLDAEPSAINRYYFGCGGGAQTNGYKVAAGTIFAFNDNTGATLNCGANLGARFFQRYEAATKKGAFLSNTWVSYAHVSVQVPTRFLGILAFNNLGVAPLGGGSQFSDARLSSFSVGSPLDTTGLNVEHLEYKGIWDKFNSTLGRGHP